MQDGPGEAKTVARSKFDELAKLMPYRRVGGDDKSYDSFLHHMNVQLPTIRKNVPVETGKSLIQVLAEHRAQTHMLEQVNE